MSGAKSGYDLQASKPFPDFASLIRATKLFTKLASRQIKEGSGTPADAVVHDLYASGAQGAPRRRRLAPPFRFGRARLPAFHHGTCGSDRTPPLSSSSRTSWDGTTVGMGVTHPRPSQYSGRCSPQAGRRAGRAFLTRSRPGAGLTTPPAGTALAPTNRRHPAGVLLGECHRMYLYRGPMSIER